MLPAIARQQEEAFNRCFLANQFALNAGNDSADCFLSAGVQKGINLTAGA